MTNNDFSSSIHTEHHAEPQSPTTLEKEQSDEGERIPALQLDGSRQQLRLSEVDRLRDIIFGPQIETYERRFADLQHEMERNSAELRKLQAHIDEVAKAQQKRFEAIELENRRMNDELHREIDRQRTREGVTHKILAQIRQHDTTLQSLSRLTGDLGKSLSQHGNDLRDLGTTMNEYNDRQANSVQALRNDLRQTADTLRDEIVRFVERLDQQKTDRRALAAMLTEIAMRLETGNSVTSLLEDLTFKPGE